MELVYLWVEKYKNIYQQGFNFSPRFECNYDGENLTITPKEHLENFFGKNINVTAIVGENGSGKSTIITSLVNYLNTVINDVFGNKYFIIFKQEAELYIISNFEIFTKYKCNHILIPTNFFNTQYIDNKKIVNFLDEINTSFYDYSLSLNTFKNINKNVFHYPNKNLDIEYIEKIDVKNIIYYILDNNHQSYFGNYFEPDKILLHVNEFEKNHFIQEKDKEINFKDKLKHIDELQNNLKSNIDHFLFFIYKYLSYEIISLSLNFNFNELEDVTDMKKYLTVITEKLSTIIKEEENNYSFDFDKKINVKSYINRIQNVLNYSNKIKESRKVLENILIFNRNGIDFFGYGMEFTLSIQNVNSDYFYIIEELPSCFDIDFEDTNKIKYADLSNGEKSALRIRFYIERIIKNTKKKKFLILLDEPNNDLHPLWQKKLLLYLIDTFKDREEYFHFIFSSHSPFILSDIPKENIVFLENGEQVYPNIDTFGANIHTLLSHGFFMKDGLMGEFAKEKINTAITYLNKKQLSEEEIEYCENIISIIGEPILKRQLQKMLDSQKIHYLAKDTREEIEFLKHRIDLLSKRL
jgi:predicted ATP-binding protein involved in virulence